MHEQEERSSCVKNAKKYTRRLYCYLYRSFRWLYRSVSARITHINSMRNDFFLRSYDTSADARIARTGKLQRICYYGIEMICTKLSIILLRAKLISKLYGTPLISVTLTHTHTAVCLLFIVGHQRHMRSQLNENEFSEYGRALSLYGCSFFFSSYMTQ